MAASPMPCARWCRAQVDFESETFIIYIPALTAASIPNRMQIWPFSANHAYALSLNARIDVLDAKCYDSPFVFGFILRSRRMQGGRNPHRSDSSARPTVGTQKLCVCCQMPVRVVAVTHFLHSSPWPFDCYAWRSPREFASYRSPHPSWPKSSEVEFQPSRCT